MISTEEARIVLKLYERWRGFRRRCLDEKDNSFDDYGGRGITVCREWANDFYAFFRWSMKAGFSEGLTLDRRDNNKGYSPNNCRWVSYEVQARNTRATVLTEDQAAEIKWLANQGRSYAAIGRLYDVSRSVVAQIDYGNNWSTTAAKRPRKWKRLLDSLPFRRRTRVSNGQDTS